MFRRDSPAEAAFRIEVRSWLEANLPAALRGRTTRPPPAELMPWYHALSRKGWIAPHWPKQYGGMGASLNEQIIMTEELARVGAPQLPAQGLNHIGPILIRFGTEAQKARHLPPIIAGTVIWAQGYSEPGAGSDLAGLRTRCEDKGDHYLINGQKVWTSYADKADWIFCLVRTDTSKKHEGISFILFDMESPGVEARPIKLISGQSPFCETFFSDVKVPKENLVGNVNGGWEIAKRLLQYERQNISSGGFGSNFGGGVELEDIAKHYIGDIGGKLADGDLRARIAAHRMEAKAFALTVRRLEAEAKAAKGPSPATSIIKYAAAKLNQDRCELMVEAMGHQGLGWDGEGFSQSEIAAMRGMLRSKGNSIEGGTSEINLNVVAKRVLGLLDHQ